MQISRIGWARRGRLGSESYTSKLWPKTWCVVGQGPFETVLHLPTLGYPPPPPLELDRCRNATVLARAARGVAKRQVGLGFGFPGRRSMVTYPCKTAPGASLGRSAATVAATRGVRFATGGRPGPSSAGVALRHVVGPLEVSLCGGRSTSMALAWVYPGSRDVSGYPFHPSHCTLATPS